MESSLRCRLRSNWSASATSNSALTCSIMISALERKNSSSSPHTKLIVVTDTEIPAQIGPFQFPLTPPVLTTSFGIYKPVSPLYLFLNKFQMNLILFLWFLNTGEKQWVLDSWWKASAAEIIINHFWTSSGLKPSAIFWFHSAKTASRTSSLQNGNDISVKIKESLICWSKRSLHSLSIRPVMSLGHLFNFPK